MSNIVEDVRVAYARCATLHLRCVAHWVNTDRSERLADLSAAAAAGMGVCAVLLAEAGAAAPVSFYEIEAVSSIPDVMTGSSEQVVAQDVFTTYQAVVDALWTVADSDDEAREALLPVLRQLGVEEEPWAA